MDHTVPFSFSGYAGMDIGRDNGLVVDRSYVDKAPFAFTGTVKKVVFDVAPHLDDKDEQALHEHASQAATVRGDQRLERAASSQSERENHERHRVRRRDRGIPDPGPRPDRTSTRS